VEQQFDSGAATKSLRRFRRRGPDRTTRLLIDALRAALESSGARDTVLLDVGAGIGAIHHELLDGAVARAIHVDASTAHLAVAREETDRRGHGQRVQFVHGDFVSVANTVPAADVVTLDRVICCYDDMEQLVGRSAEKAGRLWGAVYPRGIAWMRFGVAVINVVQRIRRSSFRVFPHDPAAIDRALRTAGLQRRSIQRTLGWEVVVYDRSGGTPGGISA
jgi:magnesium-protoporphyrin O-methyltransferase